MSSSQISPGPFWFSAVIEKKYSWSSLSLGTLYDVSKAFRVATSSQSPSGLLFCFTMYPVTLEPPSEDGDFQSSVTKSGPSLDILNCLGEDGASKEKQTGYLTNKHTFFLPN